MSAEAVIWHDLECGGYRADLPYWHTLAERCAGVVLDVGAGTGRVALPLARAGHAVVALERDAALAAELARRAATLAVEVRCADACAFTLDCAVALAIVPMQTIHLLEDRPAFLACVRRALRPRGRLAVALLGDGVEPFELELDPDAVQLGAVRYESVPTGLRRRDGVVALERRRSRIHDGASQSSIDLTCLRECDSATLVAEAQACGFAPLEHHAIAPTREHAGSEIVCLEVGA
ncbi:MAG TPA: class I SAM-dependent methyltransferase [Solirubrobacteraceae bacterium]|nr:class I SAM-dependent methyltransferase [Solirubrobacteraceae bacterium]